jgi:hypothetical protein
MKVCTRSPSLALFQGVSAFDLVAHHLRPLFSLLRLFRLKLKAQLRTHLLCLEHKLLILVCFAMPRQQINDPFNIPILVVLGNDTDQSMVFRRVVFQQPLHHPITIGFTCQVKRGLTLHGGTAFVFTIQYFGIDFQQAPQHFETSLLRRNVCCRHSMFVAGRKHGIGTRTKQQFNNGQVSTGTGTHQWTPPVPDVGFVNVGGQGQSTTSITGPALHHEIRARLQTALGNTGHDRSSRVAVVVLSGLFGFLCTGLDDTAVFQPSAFSGDTAISVQERERMLRSASWMTNATKAQQFQQQQHSRSVWVDGIAVVSVGLTFGSE